MDRIEKDQMQDSSVVETAGEKDLAEKNFQRRFFHCYEILNSFVSMLNLENKDIKEVAIRYLKLVLREKNFLKQFHTETKVAVILYLACIKTRKKVQIKIFERINSVKESLFCFTHTKIKEYLINNMYRGEENPFKHIDAKTLCASIMNKMNEKNFNH